MIKYKCDLQRYLKLEKEIYLNKGDRFEKYLTHDVSIVVWRYVKYLRKTEYYHNQGNFVSKILYVLYRRKKNKLGIKLGMEMTDNTFEEGLTIYHPGNIVVNGFSKIGKNCKLHGDNCIGNNGKDLGSPIIGDNVRLGVGAKVIGKITIANNVTVAAGAVVVKSVLEDGVTVAGIPAQIVKRTSYEIERNS